MQERTRDEQLAYRREVNRRWRERNPDANKRWRASLSPERIEEQRIKKAAAHKRRREAAIATDAEALRSRQNAAAHRWREAHREDRREHRKAYYQANAEKFRQRARDWGNAHPEYVRDRYLRRHYGITLAEYQALHQKQGGVCAICEKPETIKRIATLKSLHVDHDHITGRVRGLLCFRCNAMLGHVAEDPAVFESAIRYLKTA